MKSKLILGLAVLFVCAACQQKESKPEKDDPKHVLIKGSIENYDGNILKIYDFMGKTEMPLEDGEFSIHLLMEKPGIRRISYGSTVFKNVFLKPRETLSFSFDTKNVDSTFTFKGSLANENNILDSLRVEQDKVNYRYVYSSALEKATQYLDSASTAQKKLLERLSINETLAGDFLSYTKASIDYNNAMYKLYIATRKDKQPENYYDFLKNVVIENEDYIDIGRYQGFLSQYIDIKANESYSALDSLKQEESDALFHESLKVVKGLKNDKVRAFALYKTMYYRLRTHGLENFEAHYNYFIAHNEDPVYAEELKSLYQIKKRLAPGQPAPEFKLENIDGKMVSLNDFKGQYVYIDFWHPGCSRSARELPYFLNLYSDYKDKNIAFLSVSGNDDEEEWRNYVKENKDIGTSLRAERSWDSKTYKDYQISGHPSFVLIDPKGKIVNAVAPKPSSEDIRATFDRLVKGE